MSVEEKKALDIVKCITEDDLLNYWEGPEEPYNAIQTVLNLIEKQAKEIEELKVINAMQTYRIEIIDEREFVSKEKIKAKIEEYKNEIKKIKNKKLCNEPKDTIYITRYEHYIAVLQSLLEEVVNNDR